MTGEVDNIRKIKLLDQLFQAYSVEELTMLIGEDLIVSKLKGIKEEIGPLMQMYDSVTLLQIDGIRYQSDIAQLKSDMTSATKILKALVETPASVAYTDLQSLKSKYNVY